MNPLKFTVASYNIWHEKYPVGGGITNNPNRYNQIGHLLGEQFDLIAIQEISETAFDAIGEQLPGYWRASQEHPNRTDGVAIFVKKALFDVKKVDEIDIPGGDNKSGILLNLFHKATRKTVDIATSHFKGGPYPARAMGDLECTTVANALDQRGGNLKILAGDFNQGSQDPQNNRVTQIKQQFEFQEQTQHEYNTEPHNNRRIDYILYKPDQNTRVSVETVHPEVADPFFRARVSDHLPWVQTFTFEGIAPLENQRILPPVAPEPPVEPVAPPETPIEYANLPIPEPLIQSPNISPQPIDQNNCIPNRVETQAQQHQNPPIPQKSSWIDWLNSFWEGMVSCLIGIFRSCGFVS